MNNINRIKNRIKNYLESIMFEPMTEEWYKAIAETVKKILIEEEYKFNDISVTYELIPALSSRQLIVTITGKYDTIKVSVDYEGRIQIGDDVINWTEKDMEDM